MPFGRFLVVVATVVLLCSSCTLRRTTTSLPDVPSGPRLAEEVTLSAAGWTHVGKITGLRGDTMVFLPSPYWGEEARTYPLDAVTALEVRREGRTGSGYVYGLSLGFAVTGALAASSARYDEDYSSGLLVAGLFGILVSGPVGAALGSTTRISRYDLAAMGVEERRELVRRLMAGDGGGTGPEEGS